MSERDIVALEEETSDLLHNVATSHEVRSKMPDGSEAEKIAEEEHKADKENTCNNSMISVPLQWWYLLHIFCTSKRDNVNKSS